MGRAYLELVTRLHAARRAGIVLGLDRVQAVLDGCGWRQADLGRVLHVGGTNGKGSTVAIAAAIAGAAGARVGRYTSPHLASIRERVVVDDTPVSERQLVELAARADRAGLAELTFFEQITVLGLLHLASARPDLTILEVGLGGRLDATNVVNADVAVVTGVAYDHQAMLGDTLAAIAQEKAGIWKRDRHAVIGASGLPDAVPTLRAAARAVGVASLDEVDDAATLAVPEVALRGAHQRRNAAAAVAGLARLGLADPQHVARGLREARHPGRLEQVSDGPVVLLDGAHNPHGAEALAAAVASLPRPRVLVLGVSEDKDVSAMLDALLPAFDRVIATAYDQPRALAPAALASSVAAHPAGGDVVVCHGAFDALGQGQAAAGAAGAVVVAGSLMLVGEVRHALLGGPCDPIVLSDPGPRR